MSPVAVLEVDQWLLSQVEKYATGQFVHQLATSRTNYLCCPELYENTQDERWREIFHEAETQLRSFVARAKQREAGALGTIGERFLD